MFGLYDSAAYGMGETGVERRILCFGRGAKSDENTAVDQDEVMEIKIYRAKGRMRIKPRVDNLQDVIRGAEKLKGPAPKAVDSIRQAMSFLQMIQPPKLIMSKVWSAQVS